MLDNGLFQVQLTLFFQNSQKQSVAITAHGYFFEFKSSSTAGQLKALGELHKAVSLFPYL